MIEPLATEELVPYLLDVLRRHGIRAIDLTIDDDGSVRGQVVVDTGSAHYEPVVEAGELGQRYHNGRTLPSKTVGFVREGFGPSIRVDLVAPIPEIHAVAPEERAS